MKGKQKPEGPRPLERGAAERLGEIVEAAERAAASVIDDAETEARRYLAEAKVEAERLVEERLDAIAELTDSLIARAEEIRHQSEALVEALEEARRRLGAEASPSLRRRPQVVPEPPRGSHLSAVAPVASPRLADALPRETQPPVAAEPNGRGGLPGARLLATQMAVSGSSREEIEVRLRNGFEIEDTAAILDAILGPEE